MNVSAYTMRDTVCHASHRAYAKPQCQYDSVDGISLISRWSGALGVCADGRGHPPGPCRAARRGGAVHLAGLLVLPARRQDHRRPRQRPLRDRAEHADRLLGLSRLEGHAGGLCVSARARKPIRRCAAIATSTRRRSSSTAPTQVIGSDRARIEGAISDTEQGDGVMSVPVSMSVSGKQRQRVGCRAARTPDTAHGEVWICSVSKSVPITIGRGENRGKRSDLLQCRAQLAEGR